MVTEFFCVRDRGRVAPQVLVKARWRHQRPLESDKRVFDIFALQTIGISRSDLVNQGLVLLQFRDDVSPVGIEGLWVLKHDFDQVFERYSFAVPGLAEIEAAVENARRVDPAQLAAYAHGSRTRIGAAVTEIVATRARYSIIFGQTHVEKQPFSKLDFLLIELEFKR